MLKVLDLSTEMRQCIDACIGCYSSCNETFVYCLQTGGEHAEANHVRLMVDCAAICKTCADIMMRGAGYSHLICSACAEICEKCASSCELIPNDAKMRDCADICRRCAEVCKRMAV